MIAIVEEDLGYQLHQAVQELKFKLSRDQDAEFRFHARGVELRIPVTRARLNRGSRKIWRRLRLRSIPFSKAPAWIPGLWTAYFLRADLLLCRRCGRFSRAALEDRGSVAETNLRRLRMAWRCGRRSSFARAEGFEEWEGRQIHVYSWRIPRRCGYTPRMTFKQLLAAMVLLQAVALPSQKAASKPTPPPPPLLARSACRS